MAVLRTILAIAVAQGMAADPATAAALAPSASRLQTTSSASSDAAMPSVEDIVAAWSTARSWVDRFSVPREHDVAAAVVIRNASALSLVLRANGAIVGRATITPVDGLALRRAASRAMGEALGSIRSAIEAGGDQVGSRLTLELEVAGTPTPLLGRTLAEAARRIRPGLDGIAMRRGERWEYAFPGRLLASNTAENPAATMGSLATDLDLPVRDLSDLREIDDVAIYRFDTIRLVQLGPGESPTTLFRGDEIVATTSITRPSTARLAADIATRLIRTAHRDATGEPAKWFRGTYRALSDDHRPPAATIFEQTLCCLALLRLPESSALDSLPRAERELIAAECRETAIAVLESLAIDRPAPLQTDGDDVFAEPRAAAAAALAVMAIDPTQRPPWLEQLLHWTMGRLVPAPDAAAAQATASSAGDDSDVIAGGDEPMPAPLDRALTAAALAHAALRGEASIDVDTARRAVAAAWASVPAEQRVSLLPWLAWAERDLLMLGRADDASMGVTSGHDAGNEPEVTSAAQARHGMLIDLREQILAFQVGFGEGLTEFAPDLLGGFVFVGPPPPFAPPQVTAQSLRPLAGLAVLLTEPTWTPEPAREPLWRRQLAGMRFLTQLTVRPPVDAQSRRPQSARWGVRQATWDSEQPTAAQAMAVLALIDSLAAWPVTADEVPPDGR